MKDLQHNQFAYSYTGELRNFHLENFQHLQNLGKILELLDLEDFQDFLNLENF